MMNVASRSFTFCRQDLSLVKLTLLLCKWRSAHLQSRNIALLYPKWHQNPDSNLNNHFWLKIAEESKSI